MTELSVYRILGKPDILSSKTYIINDIKFGNNGKLNKLVYQGSLDFENKKLIKWKKPSLNKKLNIGIWND